MPRVRCGFVALTLLAGALASASASSSALWNLDGLPHHNSTFCGRPEWRVPEIGGFDSLFSSAGNERDGQEAQAEFVALLIYSPACYFSSEMEAIMSSVAGSFPALTIVKFNGKRDGQFNGFTTRGFPCLMLFKRTGSFVARFRQERSAGRVAKWLSKHTSE